ncbi:response regulator [Alteromonas flava]|uniref:response regulator n=1 Tax=Alteromonas flava TaxID=2048003 RepID=UPI000F5E1656|nr:response regulator [Alteromonas flava]
MQNIRVKYFLAVSILACMVTFTWGWLSYLIGHQRNDASIINVAGQQRMLSQRIALLSYQQLENEKHLETLSRAVNQFKENNQYLLELEVLPSRVSELYFGYPELQQRVIQYIDNAEAFVEQPTPQMQQVLGQNDVDTLLYDLNAVVEAFEAAANERTDKLFQLETIIWLVSLLILVLEVLFIFEPMRAQILQQIDKLKLAIAEAKQAEQKAIEAKQVKSQFLANMSHELRTPMTGMFGMLDLAESNPDKAQSFITKAKRSGQQLLDLINDILDFEKIESGKMTLSPTDFSLLELMDNICTNADILCRQKGIYFVYECPNDLPHYVHSDPSKLSQILTNIVTNAVKFTHEGEVRLTVTTPVINNAHHIEMRIKDTGIGMTSEQQQKIFQAFTQADSSTSRKFGGTGLGLSIVSKLVEMFNGNIRVDSEVGKGSTFIVCIPVKIAEPPAIQEHQISIGRKLTCAIVDDLEATREFIDAQASALGYEVQRYESGVKFLNDSPCVDVLIIDLFMPDLDGFDVLRKLRQFCNTYPSQTIMITAAYDQVDIPEDLADDIQRLTKKPLDKQQVRQLLLNAKDKVLNRRSENLSGKFILVVEDNPINAEIVKTMLTTENYKTLVAVNGQEAIDVLNSLSKKPDLVLMDMQMPVLDGVAATTIIREKLNLKAPIIGLTANAQPSDRVVCIEAGMNDVVTKPIDKALLLDTIEQYLNP